MKAAYSKIEIENISPDHEYDGYYWMSDKRKPEVVRNEKIDKEKFDSLPFVVEANFYCAKENKSLQIKNIDGEYHVAEIDFKNLPEDKYDEHVYIAHDLDGIGKYKMYEAWDEEPDENTEGFAVLVPTWSAFAGFL